MQVSAESARMSVGSQAELTQVLVGWTSICPVYPAVQPLQESLKGYFADKKTPMDAN